MVIEALVLPNFRSFDLPLINYNPVHVPELEPSAIPEVVATETGTATGEDANPRSSMRRTYGGLKQFARKTLTGVPSVNTAVPVDTAPVSVSPTVVLAEPSAWSLRKLGTKDVMHGKCIGVGEQLTVDNLNVTQDQLITQFV